MSTSTSTSTATAQPATAQQLVPAPPAKMRLISRLEADLPDHVGLSLKELGDLFAWTGGARRASIMALTVPNLYTKGNPFQGEIWKLAYDAVTVNFYYENSVNNQRLREGLEPDFAAMPRAWGRRIPKTPFIEHYNEAEGRWRYYLETRVDNVIRSMYVDRQGEIIPREAVQPFEKPARPTRQGVDKETRLRDYSVENLLAVCYVGKSYVIDHRKRLRRDAACAV